MLTVGSSPIAAPPMGSARRGVARMGSARRGVARRLSTGASVAEGGAASEGGSGACVFALVGDRIGIGMDGSVAAKV